MRLRVVSFLLSYVFYVLYRAQPGPGLAPGRLAAIVNSPVCA